MENPNPHRRQFVRAALVTAASYGRILGANDRIRMGAIGTGGRCQYLLSQLKLLENNEIVACCDVYEPRRLDAKAKYATADASLHVDYREVLDRKDIDAVVVGTPDHWHVPVTIASVRAGKDVYCEKPVTHTLEEAAPLLAAVRETNRVVQTGTQQRSWEHFAQARDVIAEGRLGQVTLIRTYWFQNHIPANGRVPSFDTSKLDWKRFLGSAADRPFDPDQFGNWRWYWDFGGGAMTDLFIHWVDVAHWIMGDDSPSRATANGLKAVLLQRQTPDTMSAALAYGKVIVEFDCALLGYIEGGGLMIRGTRAGMRLWRGGFEIYDEIPRYSENPNPSNAAMEVKSKQDGTLPHMKNFLDCVRSRKQPNAHVEIGIAAARAGHVANLAMRGSGVWNAGGRG
ncbi:MAG TPA: Gfo/Idh/MocA family oxidoreductase [Candidatus Solibacter sp.]|jgi:predicted dehydrogenase